MIHLLRPAAAALLVTAIAAPALAATTPLDGQVHLQAYARLAKTIHATDTGAQAWVGLPADLAASASATAVSGKDSVSAFGAVAADWVSPEEGDVTFHQVGWVFDVHDPANSHVDAEIRLGGDDWVYRFTAGSDGTFVMKYDIAGTGNTFGLEGWNFGFDGPGGGQAILDPFVPDASGFLTRALLAGHTYRVSLKNNANVVSDGILDWAGHMDGSFRWTILSAPAPEPGAWSLMLLGFGLVGLAARRRGRGEMASA